MPLSTDPERRRPVIEPSIEDLKALQHRLGMRDHHVVWVGPSRFVVAHTDDERATIDVEECDLHGWLHGLDGPPVESGYYVARRHEPDAYSEPYGTNPWDLYPLDDEATEVA